MKVTKQVMTEKVVDIQCDVCGKSCTKPEGCGAEYATLMATWGYWSNKDQTEHECHMCEECYDKVKDFIEQQLKGKVRKYYYDIWNGCRLNEE